MNESATANHLPESYFSVLRLTCGVNQMQHCKVADGIVWFCYTLSSVWKNYQTSTQNSTSPHHMFFSFKLSSDHASLGHLAWEIAPQYQETNIKTKVYLAEAPIGPETFWVLQKLAYINGSSCKNMCRVTAVHVKTCCGSAVLCKNWGCLLCKSCAL